MIAALSTGVLFGGDISGGGPAIRSVTIGGDVRYGVILSDGNIGTISVGGNWTTSTVAANVSIDVYATGGNSPHFLYGRPSDYLTSPVSPRVDRGHRHRRPDRQ